MASEGPIERPRGGLSKADREYLLDDRTYDSEQAERNTRARIRKRLLHSLLDFNLALEALSERDRRQIFSMDGPHTDLPAGLLGTIGLIYQGVTDSGEPSFEQILVEGINRAEAKRGYIADVEFNVQRRPLEFDDIRTRMKDGEEIPGIVITEMLQQGEIEMSELEEYLEQVSDSESEQSPE
jgi:hypothetical protein